MSKPVTKADIARARRNNKIRMDAYKAMIAETEARGVLYAEAHETKRKLDDTILFLRWLVNENALDHRLATKIREHLTKLEGKE